MRATMDYDDMASKYATSRMAVPPVLDALVGGSGIDTTSRVLEVGCGTGNYIMGLKMRTGATCLGLDPSCGMISHIHAPIATVETVQGFAEQLPFLGDFFDLVFSVDVVHHLDDLTRYLAEANRVLVDGGILCTVTQSERLIRDRVPLTTYFPETVGPELERYPSKEILRREMVSAGFHYMMEEVVAWPYELRDASPYRARAFSCLHLIPDEAFQRGLARMEADLERGPLPCVARYLLLWGRR